MKTPALLEKRSCAYTLSDMEIFIFPELFYALVLANVLSPQIWKWRDDPWFKNIEKKSFNYKINRVKQYIMDHYVFNLDLDTWGLTDKQTEIDRFKDFISSDALAQSNALFGYEGDKYYFSIDIRKHFGLDKYTDSSIPYWKTETAEAMNAFRYKEGYGQGAGECVSLATLYAAAMFVVGRIPLEKIFLIATPLHSQSFIDEKDGFITNNRRIVTKSMWYNGTLLSAKARRAIENENITIVSHVSGHIHTFYENASIDPEAYAHFSNQLKQFLNADLTFETFVNFLRSDSDFWNCFQYEYSRNGKPAFLELAKIFEYERNSKNAITQASRDALFQEMDAADFHLAKRDDRILLNLFETYLNEHSDASFEEKRSYFETEILECPHCPQITKLFEKLALFLRTEPRLPNIDQKQIKPYKPLNITTDMEHQAIFDQLCAAQDNGHELADLCFHAFRHMDRVDWQPYIKAAIDRNPLCLNTLLKFNDDQKAFEHLNSLDNESIYDSKRLALPDEVWNFGRGDGLEKAIAMGAYLVHRYPEQTFQLLSDGQSTYIGTFKFDSDKDLKYSFLIGRSGIVDNA